MRGSKGTRGQVWLPGNFEMAGTIDSFMRKSIYWKKYGVDGGFEGRGVDGGKEEAV